MTKVIYLEDPDQAIPLRMAKDQISVVTLSPTEPPLRVASALGRPVAIVRIGGRRPTGEEIQGGVAGDIGLDWVESIGSKPCPFLCHSGARCALAVRAGVRLGAAAGSAHVAARRVSLRRRRPGNYRLRPTANGRISGIEPRDAVVRFDFGVKGRDAVSNPARPTWSACTPPGSPRSA